MWEETTCLSSDSQSVDPEPSAAASPGTCQKYTLSAQKIQKNEILEGDDFYFEFKVVMSHVGGYGQNVIDYLYLELRQKIWAWIKDLNTVYLFVLGSN